MPSLPDSLHVGSHLCEGEADIQHSDQTITGLRVRGVAPTISRKGWHLEEEITQQPGQETGENPEQVSPGRNRCVPSYPHPSHGIRGLHSTARPCPRCKAGAVP